MFLLERKIQANKIAALYKQIGYDRLAERISNCMSYAKVIEKRGRDSFPWDLRMGADDLGYIHSAVNYETRERLVESSFCRVRLCPICQWRKGVRWQALAIKDFDKVYTDFEGSRFLFLTLTVKNCELLELSKIVKHLNQSFLRWVRWKKFPGKGWIKSLEITLDKTNKSLCHPHFHILLLVPKTYFDEGNYWTQKQWVQGWREVAKLDYDPIIDIRAVKEKDKGIIPEILKYGVKPSDLVEVDTYQLIQLTKQLQGIHSINKGGCLRGYLKSVGSDQVDLIGKKDDDFFPTGWETDRYWNSDINGFNCDWSFQGKQRGYWVETEANSDYREVTLMDEY